MATATRLDADVIVTPDEVTAALERPRDFGWFGRDEMFVTWSLGPVIRHRDSGLLDQSNADALEAHLRTDPSLEDDWDVTRCNHWAVGWCDHLSFRAVEADGVTPTRIMRVLKAWHASLEGYPVADEDDWSRREYEATCDNIEDAAHPFTKDDLPEDWVSTLYTWFWDHSPCCVEADGADQGGYPCNDTHVEAALKACGFWDDTEDGD